MLVMKSGKRHLTDGLQLPNQNKIRTLAENETYKYLGILKADTVKQVEMKDKIQKEYLMIDCLILPKFKQFLFFYTYRLWNCIPCTFEFRFFV